MSDSKVLTKLEDMDERLDKIDVHLAVYNEQLKVHISGTVDNRESIALLRKDLKPIEAHVSMVNGGLKLIGIVALVLAAFESVKNLFS